MSGESPERTVYDNCDSWAGMPAWAFDCPGMTPRAFQAFGLLILWSDKRTGMTPNVKRKTLAARLGWTEPTLDRAIAALVKIGCVAVIANKRTVTKDDGSTGWVWGASQYSVSLATPRGVLTSDDTPPGGVLTSDDRCTHPRVQGVLTSDEPNQECSIKSVSINSSLAESSGQGDSAAKSQATSQRENHVKEILQGRTLPRTLRHDPLDFVLLMKQMSHECFHDELHLITQTNYNDVKAACVEIADWLANHHKLLDPAYIHAFAAYYESLDHDRFSTPKPASYRKNWDDDAFWNEPWIAEIVESFREEHG